MPVVRLNPSRAMLKVFLKEQWAIARAREAGVPTPEVLDVGSDPLPYMILRKSQGEPATFHPDRIRILHDLGGYAARINSIRTHGFGDSFDWWRNELSSSAQGWEEFLRTEFELDKRLRTLGRRGMLPHRQLERVRAILRAAGGKDRRPALNHGDLRLKNVLVDGKGRISAILDWEKCSSQLAPEWELSLALHDLSIDEKEALVSGYGLSAKVFSAMASTIKALNLVNYVSEIERLAKAKDKTQLEYYRIRLKGALDLYCL
jgi:aminoglycoside phosphotransferase (APT) family kinase protein